MISGKTKNSKQSTQLLGKVFFCGECGSKQLVVGCSQLKRTLMKHAWVLYLQYYLCIYIRDKAI